MNWKKWEQDMMMLSKEEIIALLKKQLMKTEKKVDPCFIPSRDLFEKYYEYWSKKKTGTEEKFTWNTVEAVSLSRILVLLKKNAISKEVIEENPDPKVFISLVFEPFLTYYVRVSLSQNYHLQSFTPSYIVGRFNDVIIKIKQNINKLSDNDFFNNLKNGIS